LRLRLFRIYEPAYFFNRLSYAKRFKYDLYYYKQRLGKLERGGGRYEL
jgi:hypothetical protein